MNIVGSVRHLMLWTERGAARHAKMLETDQAWDVFDKLEDYYFSESKKTTPELPSSSGPLTSDQQTVIKDVGPVPQEKKEAKPVLACGPR